MRIFSWIGVRKDLRSLQIRVLSSDVRPLSSLNLTCTWNQRRKRNMSYMLCHPPDQYYVGYSGTDLLVHNNGSFTSKSSISPNENSGMSKCPLIFLFSSLINHSPDKHYHELHCSSNNNRTLEWYDVMSTSKSQAQFIIVSYSLLIADSDLKCLQSNKWFMFRS